MPAPPVGSVRPGLQSKQPCLCELCIPFVSTKQSCGGRIQDQILKTICTLQALLGVWTVQVLGVRPSRKAGRCLTSRWWFRGYWLLLSVLCLQNSMPLWGTAANLPWFCMPFFHRLECLHNTAGFCFVFQNRIDGIRAETPEPVSQLRKWMN